MTAEPPALLHPARIRTIADVPKYARPWYVLGDSPAKTLGRAARAAATLAQQVRILDGALVDQQQVLNARSAEIVELRATVKAVANRGQVLVSTMEMELLSLRDTEIARVKLLGQSSIQVRTLTADLDRETRRADRADTALKALLQDAADRAALHRDLAPERAADAARRQMIAHAQGGAVVVLAAVVALLVWTAL